MKRNPLYLSIAIILASSGAALTGCSSSSSSDDNGGDPAATVRGVMCIDQNSNGKCDTGETSKSNVESGTIPAELMSSEYQTVMTVSDGSVFVAKAGSTEISAYSTLINNEVFYNPTINGDASQASNYLKDKLSIDGSLNADQAVKFQASVASALKVSPDANPMKAIAAVVDKAVAGSKLDVTVTAEEIASQTRAKHSYKFTGAALSWEESDGDEDTRGVVILKDRDLAVIATDEHNSLLVVDVSDAAAPKITSQKLFAAVEGERYELDSVSGASEHGLTGISASPDGQHVYVSVTPDDGIDSVGNDQDDKYGLFRVAISDAGISADHNDATTLRYDNAYVEEFSITADGKVLVVDGDADVIRILDAELNDTGAIVELPDTLDASGVYFSDSLNSIYVTTEGDSDATPAVLPKLHKVDGSTGVASASLDLSSDIEGFVVFNDGKQALAYHEDYYAVILDLENMVVSKELPISEALGQTIETATVTPDGQYAVIAGHDNTEVWVFDLTAPDVRMELLESTETRIRGLGADDNGNIYGVGRDGSVLIKKPVAGDVLTPKAAVAKDIEFIKNSDINNGLPLSVVVSNLALATEIPAGSGSAINWSSTLSSVNTTVPTNDDALALGAVTRPEGSNETGTVTANLSYNFRDISESDTANFNIEVRQAAADLPATGLLAGGTYPDGYVQFIDASPSGDRGVAVYRELGGFNVILRDDNDVPEYALNTTENEGAIYHQALPAPYTEIRAIGVQFLSDSVVLIAAPEGEDADENSTSGAFLVYSVDDNSIADGVAPMLGQALVLDGTIEAISHLTNNRLAAVIEVAGVDGADATRKAIILNTSNPSSLSIDSEIALPTDTGFIEISDDGQSVYVVADEGNGDLLSIYSGSTGTAVASVGASDDITYRSLALSNGILFMGSTTGKLYQYNSSDLSQVGEAYISGYGGRIQNLDVINGRAFLSIWGYGVSVVDISEQKELAFYQHSRQRRAGVSDDGKWIFGAIYHGRAANDISILKVPN